MKSPVTAAPRSTLSPGELGLLARAQSLVRAATAGPPQRLLAGKNIGLVCTADDDAGAKLFTEAASQLGAKVSQVRPGLGADSPAAEVATTARLLGRLYDALAFLATPPELVQRIGREAGVPVLDGAAEQLASRLESELPAPEGRRFVVQALLLDVLSPMR